MRFLTLLKTVRQQLNALFWVILTWQWDVVSLTYTPFPFFFHILLFLFIFLSFSRNIRRFMSGKRRGKLWQRKEICPHGGDGHTIFVDKIKMATKELYGRNQSCSNITLGHNSHKIQQTKKILVICTTTYWVLILHTKFHEIQFMSNKSETRPVHDISSITNCRRHNLII